MEAQRNKMKQRTRICSSAFRWNSILFFLLIALVNAAPEGRIDTDKIHQERKEQRLKDELEEITEELKIYEDIIENFLKPVNKITNLEEKIGKLSEMSTKNNDAITDIKSKLSIDTKNISTSFDRQEARLSDLQSQTADLQKKWDHQQTDLQKLKNEWSELSVQLELSDSDASKLRKSNQDINEALVKQNKKIEDQETTAERLESLLKDAEQSMMDLKKDVEEIFNNQDQLETQLKDLQSELTKIPEGKSAPADSLCRGLRLG